MLSIGVALSLSIYGMLPYILGLESNDALLALFPPFVSYAPANQQTHLGAEYRNIALSLYHGDGFSSPSVFPRVQLLGRLRYCLS